MFDVPNNDVSCNFGVDGLNINPACPGDAEVFESNENFDVYIIVLCYY